MKLKFLPALLASVVLSLLTSAPAHATGGTVQGSLTLPNGVTFDASASQTTWMAGPPDQGLIEIALPGFNTQTGMTFDITINGVNYNQQTATDLNNWVGDCAAPNDATKCIYVEITGQGDLTGTTSTISGSVSYTSTFDFTDVIADFAAIGLTVLQSDLVNMVQTQEEENYSHFYVTLSNNTSASVNFTIDEFKVDGVATTRSSSEHITIAAGETSLWQDLGKLPGNLQYGLANAPLALTLTEYEFSTVSVGSLVLPSGVTVRAHQPQWWEYNAVDNTTCVNLVFDNSSSRAYSVATKPMTMTVGASTVSNSHVNYMYIPANGSAYFWSDTCLTGDLRYNSTITLGGTLPTVVGPKLVNKIKLPSGLTASMNIQAIYYDSVERKSYLGMTINGSSINATTALRFSDVKVNGKAVSGDVVTGSYERESGGYEIYFTFTPIAGDQRLGKTFTVTGKVTKETKTRVVNSLVTSGMHSDTWRYLPGAEGFTYDAKKKLTTITLSLGNGSSNRARFDLSRVVIKTQIKDKKGKWTSVKSYASTSRTVTINSNSGGEFVIAKIPGDLRSNWKAIVFDGTVTSTILP